VYSNSVKANTIKNKT